MSHLSHIFNRTILQNHKHTHTHHSAIHGSRDKSNKSAIKLDKSVQTHSRALITKRREDELEVTSFELKEEKKHNVIPTHTPPY